MKVLHVYKTYFPEDFTGVPRVIHGLAEALSSQGVESHVLALSKGSAKPDPLHVGSHTLHRVQRSGQVASTDFSLGVFKRFGQLAEDMDLIHYHFPWPLADLMYLLHGRNKPAVVTYHSDVVKQKRLMRLYAPVMHQFLARVDRIVATSPNYARSSPVLQRYADKTDIIPLGIGPRAAVLPERRAHWQRQVGEGFFLFVGAPRYYKGLPFLLAAARQTGLPVVLAGVAQADLAGLDVPNNVTMLGSVSDDDKEALLDLCLCFVLPSHLRSEAFGVALLEATRAGKPMISCEIGTGTSFVNQDGITGRVIPPGDAQALAWAMQEMTLRSDALQQSQLKIEIARIFSLEQTSSSYLQLYGKLLKAHRESIGV